MSRPTDRRILVGRLAAADWGDNEEKTALLVQARQAGLPPAEALELALSGDGDVAAAGLELFAARAAAKDLREMIHGTPKASPEQRASTRLLIPALPSALVRETLDGMLEEDDPNSRRLAWETAIALTGGLRRHYLRKAVATAPPAMRMKALRLLVEDQGAVALVPMLLKLADGEDARLALTALEGLVEVREPEVLEFMLKCFVTREEAERKIAAGYLQTEAKAEPEKVRKTMLGVLTHGDRSLAEAASQILLATGDPATVVLDSLEFGRGLLGWLRERIMEGLRRGGTRVLDAAVELLDHEDDSVRFYALTLAEGFREPGLVGIFCRLLNDPDWWLRVTVCDSLAQLGDERAVPYLLQALEDPDVRWAAIDALGRIGSVSAIQPLMSMLSDPKPEVRMDVLVGLSRLKDERLMPVLRKVRDEDADVPVRRRANEVLNRLVRELGLDTEEGALDAPSYKEFEKPLERILARVRELAGSDLHISPGEPPLIRLDGELRPLSKTRMSAEQTEALIQSVLEEEQKKEMVKHGALDFRHTLEGVGAYRCSSFRQRKGWSATFRVIPAQPPVIEELGVPPELRDVLSYHQGLIVVCGPSGHGKSSTLAALVDLINERKPVHIISLEDPIELAHPPKLALINQRQIRRHTQSYADGLRAALREDPDVVMIGDMRDRDTIRHAMQAAETGHLVLGTLDTRSAVQAIDRMIGAFPPLEQAQVAQALSETLKWILSQTLLPRRGGSGRVAAFETLRVTPSVGHTIRKGETFKIQGLMQIGRHLGNRTRDQALAELVQSFAIRPESAWLHADKPETFARQCDPEWLDRQGTW